MARRRAGPHMKAIVYNPLNAVWRPRLPAVLSVTQELLDQGHEVVYIGCTRSVPACTANLDLTRAICNYCVQRRDLGLGLLTGELRRRDLTDYLEPNRLASLMGSRDELPDLEALRALHYRGADVGYAAFSSYAYTSRKPEPDLGSRPVARVLQRLVNTGKIVYEAMRNALAAERPDRVIVYHGRSAIDRAALRACQHAGVECFVYEVPLSQNELMCFRNALPHDVDNAMQAVDALWEQAGDDKHAVGKAFFEMHRHGTRVAQAAGTTIETTDQSYSRRQVHGRLPADFDEQRTNLVIYGTSNDEFIAITPDYERGIYSSQIEALDRISADLEDAPAYHIYFRVHPRQAGVADDYTAALAKLGARSNVTIVDAASDVSSYALLDGATLVLVFRSTMAIEAVYGGKPCIVLSASYYKSLGATYNPESHAEVMELIRSLPPPKDPLPAIKMAYYLMKRGFAHPYFGADIGKGRQGYTFRGNTVLLGGLAHWRYFLSRERQRFKWRRLV